VCGAAVIVFDGYFKFHRFGRWWGYDPLPTRFMLVKPMRNPVQLIWREFPMAGGVSILVDGYIARNQGRSNGDGAADADALKAMAATNPRLDSVLI
jgi:hypothetical protein